MELPDGEKKLRICVTVYTQYRRVTDGRTDRHTYILPRHSPLQDGNAYVIGIQLMPEILLSVKLSPGL